MVWAIAIVEPWIEFLKEPEWYKIFETDLHLRLIPVKSGNTLL